MRTIFFAMTAVLVVVGGAVYVAFFGAPAAEECRPTARLHPPASDTTRLHHPMGLAIIPWDSRAAGVLYVANAERGTIKQYRDDGTPLASWSGFTRPLAVAATGGTANVIYVVTT